jgi:hypothetical protein
MNSRPLKALFIKEQKLKDNRDEELTKITATELGELKMPCRNPSAEPDGL